MVDMKVRNGVVDDKGNLLNDVSKAFKEGLFSDVTFVMADGVNIVTSKFMLACRVPYFAPMLFGGLAENSDKPIPLTCCDAIVFQEILTFVFEGEVSFSAMGLPLLLDFLETCRFFCIERLVDSIIEHLKSLLEGNKINSKDCLAAFEFVEENQFMAASDLFLSYIDKNLSNFSDLEEFGNLKEKLLKKVLQNVKSNCEEIVRFLAFTKWLNKNETFQVPERNKILSSFDLRKFDDTDLVNVVRKFELFNEKDICDVLGERLEARNNEREQFRQLALQSEVVNFNLIVYGHILSLNTRAQFKFPAQYQNHYINKVEFSLDHGLKFSFTLEGSQDGHVWSDICQCTDVSGKQNLFFERRKMKAIGLKLTQSNGFLDQLRVLTVRMV